MKKTPAIFRHSRPSIVAALATLLVAAPACCAGPPKSLCSVTDYKILNPNSIAVECGDIVATAGISGQGGTVYLGDDLSSPLPVTFTASPYDDDWLFLLFTPNSGTMTPVFKAQTKYKIAIKLSRTLVDAKGNKTTEEGYTSTLIDTSASLTLASAFVAAGGPNNYEVKSHLGFQGLGMGLGPNNLNQTVDCSLVVENFTGTFTTKRAKCKQTQSALDGHPGLPDPGTVGTLELFPEGNADTQSIPYKIAELQNIFGTPMTLDPKSRLGQAKAPATKDASSYYVNGSYAAGRGSKPGLILDAKAAPPIGRLYGGWQFAPTVTANIGSNSISGMTYTDTIDFGLTESRPLELRGALQEIYASGSAVYETDREFDRENVTGVADLRYNFRGLYSPRAVETLRMFGNRQTIAKAHGITLQQSDVAPPFLGYALDFHTGIEFGGAIVDTTVKATTGKATIALPAYSIFRVVPQVHGLLEMGHLSVDAVGTPRYLAATENTVIQLPNNSLQLKTVHGWNGYGVLTSAFSLDPAGHFSLNVTYKDGFAPPKFARINAVQAGILVKF
jgi:hypothetical protein